MPIELRSRVLHTEDSARKEAEYQTGKHYGKRAKGKFPKEIGSKEIHEINGVISYIKAELIDKQGWVFLAWIVDPRTGTSGPVPIGEVEFLDASADATPFPQAATLVPPETIAKFAEIRFT